MSSHWSLLFFTLLVQSAVGCVWCIQLMLCLGIDRVDSPPFKYQLAVILGLLLLSLVSAMAHLGKPTASIHAGRKFKDSWLSKEILAVNAFVGVLAVLLVLAFSQPEILNRWMMLAVSLAGGLALYAMTKVYLIRTVPAWNHAGTPLAFLGTALLLGAVLYSLLQSGFATIPNFADHLTSLALYQQIAYSYIIGLLGLGLKVSGAGVKSFKNIYRPEPARHNLPIIQMFGFAILTAAILFNRSFGVFLIVFVWAAIAIIVGEINDRVKFYNNYHRVGI
jgi:DMSO reductase anchor subunit